jgi:putative peptidoglycan lipid II flippase
MNAYRRFVFPALCPVWRAMVNLVFIFAFKDRWGVHAIAMGYVAGEIVRAILLYVYLRRSKLLTLRYSWTMSPQLNHFFRTATYQSIGMVAVGLNPIVSKAMASWLGAGAVSIFEYAYRLYLIPTTFLTSGLIVTLLSHWSRTYCEEGMEALRRRIGKVLLAVTGVSLAVSAAMILLAKPLTALAYDRGQFDSASLHEVSMVWVFFLVGTVFHMLEMVYARIFVVIKATHVLTIGAVVAVLANAGLCYVLMSAMGVRGIALANSLSVLLYLVYLVVGFGWLQRRRVG